MIHSFNKTLLGAGCRVPGTTPRAAAGPHRRALPPCQSPSRPGPTQPLLLRSSKHSSALPFLCRSSSRPPGVFYCLFYPGLKQLSHTSAPDREVGERQRRKQLPLLSPERPPWAWGSRVPPPLPGPLTPRLAWSPGPEGQGLAATCACSAGPGASGLGNRAPGGPPGTDALQDTPQVL